MPDYKCTQAYAAETAYDEVADYYDQAFCDPIALAEDQVIVSLLAKYYHPLDKVIDLGCGTGLLLEYFETMRPNRYYGIDVSEKMLAKARKKFPDHYFAHNDMCKIPSKADSYDMAISTFCSMSYPPLYLALLEAYRVLRPGGTLFAVLAAPGYENRETYVLKDKADRAPMNHYESGMIINLAEMVGFGNIKLQQMQWNIEKLKIKKVGILAYLLRFEMIIGNLIQRPGARYQILIANKPGPRRLIDQDWKDIAKKITSAEDLYSPQGGI